MHHPHLHGPKFLHSPRTSKNSQGLCTDPKHAARNHELHGCTSKSFWGGRGGLQNLLRLGSQRSKAPVLRSFSRGSDEASLFFQSRIQSKSEWCASLWFENNVGSWKWGMLASIKKHVMFPGSPRKAIVCLTSDICGRGASTSSSACCTGSSSSSSWWLLVALAAVLCLTCGLMRRSHSFCPTTALHGSVACKAGTCAAAVRPVLCKLCFGCQRTLEGWTSGFGA